MKSPATFTRPEPDTQTVQSLTTGPLIVRCECRKWVTSGPSGGAPGTSAVRGRADGIRGKLTFGLRLFQQPRLQTDMQPPEIEVCLYPSFGHSGQGWECLKVTHSGSRGSPIRDTLYRRLQPLVTSMTAPIASGRSDGCRVGFAPTEERRLSTAHTHSRH